MDYKLKCQELTDTVEELRIEINNLKQVNLDHQRINGQLRIRVNEMFVKGKSKFKFEIPDQSGDEATAEIILSGEKYNKRWAVVPCCIKGVQAHGVNKFSGWIGIYYKFCFIY